MAQIERGFSREKCVSKIEQRSVKRSAIRDKNEELKREYLQLVLFTRFMGKVWITRVKRTLPPPPFVYLIRSNDRVRTLQLETVL